MSSSFSKFGSWLGRKLSVLALVTLAGFATCGLWFFVHGADDYAAGRDAFAARSGRLHLKVAVLDKQVADLDARIVARQHQVEQSGRVIKTLRGQDGVWERLFGDHAQQRENAARRARMEALRKTAAGDLAHLLEERDMAARARAEARAELARTDRALHDLERGRSEAWHCLREAWHRGRWYVAAVAAAWLLGPTLMYLGLYYGMAPLMTRGGPLRLAKEAGAAASAGPGGAAVENALWPGETLLVRPRLLAAADGDLTRRRRWVLSWRFPVASLAAGLAGLTEVRNVCNDGERRVTLADARRTPGELAVIDVPEGGALVVRPAFLAGVLTPRGEAPVIRRHLRVFCRQAWVSGQFRFFEFAGPCRLILANGGALRAESLLENPDAPSSVPATRVRQPAVVAFTPSLECRPVRAVSFWRYYRGDAPLFEAGFFGRGVVAHAATGERAGAGRRAPSRRLLKLFGV